MAAPPSNENEAEIYLLRPPDPLGEDQLAVTDGAARPVMAKVLSETAAESLPSTASSETPPAERPTELWEGRAVAQLAADIASYRARIKSLLQENAALAEEARKLAATNVSLPPAAEPNPPSAPVTRVMLFHAETNPAQLPEPEPQIALPPSEHPMNLPPHRPLESLKNPAWPEAEVLPIHSHFDHVRNELRRLQQILRRGVMLVRRPEALGSILINNDEAEELAQRQDLLNEWPEREDADPEIRQFQNAIDRMRTDIDARVAAAQRPAENGSHLPLPLADLRKACRLEPDEFDILLLAFAASLSADYGSMFGYLQNDGSRSDPSVNLALNLLNGPIEERLAHRRYFLPSGTLIRHRLIHLEPRRDEREKPLLRQHFRIDEMIASFLLGHKMPAGGALDVQTHSIGSVAVDLPTENRLRKLAVQLRGQSHAVVRFVGTQTETLLSAAESVAAESGHTLRIILDLTADSTDAEAIGKAVRNARLWGAVLIVAGHPAHGSPPPAQREAERALWQALEGAEGIVFLLGPEGTFGRAPAGVRYWNVEIGRADYDRRQQAWARQLGPYVGPSIDAARVAGTFRFGHAHMRQAIHFGRGLAAQRGEPLTTDDLISAGRELTVPQVARFARRTRPQAQGWGHLKLPPDKMEQLRQIKRRMEHRQEVFGTWGFGKMLTRGKGLTVLFTGPSGTGKTYAAEMLAARLRLDLYQIDLAGVMSKYIGETEANLGAIFDAAEESGALLFFDEADALFGKRTETKDAHDRYANIEIDYLLQRVEAHQGIVVLATNLQRNMDDAFVRRIQEIVEFPAPDEPARAAILRAHLPEKFTAVSEEEIAFIARQFEMTGGNLKNVALDAAFRAASDARREPRKIEMQDLIRAVAAELRKEGRLCLDRDFASYHHCLDLPPDQPEDSTG